MIDANARECDLGRRAMEHVRVLAADIGPRGSCTEADRRGARYIAAQAGQFANRVTTEEFRSYTSFSWPYALIYLVGSLAGFATLWWPVAGLAAGLLVLVVFYLQNTSLVDVGALFPQWPTENVVAVVHPKGETPPPPATPQSPAVPPRRVVLVAHHDTSRSSIAFAPGQVKSFRLTFLLMAAAFVATPAAAALALLGARLAGAGAWLAAGRWLGLFPGIYLTASAGLIAHRELTGVYTAGANDNASGVGVALAVAEDLAGRSQGTSSRPDGRDGGQGALANTELWCVFTGGEEVGQTGMVDFVRRHGAEFRDAFFINLDNVGAGAVRYATGEGMLGIKPCDPTLVTVARRVAAEHPEWDLQGVPVTVMTTDANVLLFRGYKVISLRAEDKDRLLPNWHWPTDTYENVDGGTVGRCAEVLREMILTLERPGPQGGGTRPSGA